MQYGESIVAVQLGEHSPLDGGGDEGLEGLGAALEESTATSVATAPVTDKKRHV